MRVRERVHSGGACTWLVDSLVGLGLFGSVSVHSITLVNIGQCLNTEALLYSDQYHVTFCPLAYRINLFSVKWPAHMRIGIAAGSDKWCWSNKIMALY